MRRKNILFPACLSRILILLLIIAGLFASLSPYSALPAEKAKAQIGGAGTTQPFGGFVFFTFFCNCSGNWAVFVGPPKGGYFIYQFTPQYANYRLPMSGMWVLGKYTQGGQCSINVVVGCATVGKPTGTITNIVGTSL